MNKWWIKVLLVISLVAVISLSFIVGINYHKIKESIRRYFSHKETVKRTYKEEKVQKRTDIYYHRSPNEESKKTTKTEGEEPKTPPPSPVYDLDRQDAEKTVKTFIVALGNEDYDTAFSLLTEGFQKIMVSGNTESFKGLKPTKQQEFTEVKYLTIQEYIENKGDLNYLGEGYDFCRVFNWRGTGEYKGETTYLNMYIAAWHNRKDNKYYIFYSPQGY